MPIVFASETFTALTGYRNDEISGSRHPCSTFCRLC